eukprot:3684860-Karenia_brevis.AAC.1
MKLPNPAASCSRSELDSPKDHTPEKREPTTSTIITTQATRITEPGSSPHTTNLLSSQDSDDSEQDSGVTQKSVELLSKLCRLSGHNFAQ